MVKGPVSEDTLGFTHRFLTQATTERFSVVPDPVLEASGVFSHPPAARGTTFLLIMLSTVDRGTSWLAPNLGVVCQGML